MKSDDKNCISNDLLKNAAPIMLALVVTAGFFGFIYLLFVSSEIPKENAAQLNILLGGIAVVWAKAIGFFYDSSASSKQKDETISDIAKSSPIVPASIPANVPNAPLPVKDVNIKAEGDVNVNPTEKTP